MVLFMIRLKKKERNPQTKEWFESWCFLW